MALAPRWATQSRSARRLRSTWRPQAGSPRCHSWLSSPTLAMQSQQQVCTYVCVSMHLLLLGMAVYDDSCPFHARGDSHLYMASQSLSSTHTGVLGLCRALHQLQARLTSPLRHLRHLTPYLQSTLETGAAAHLPRGAGPWAFSPTAGGASSSGRVGSRGAGMASEASLLAVGISAFAFQVRSRSPLLCARQVPLCFLFLCPT